MLAPVRVLSVGNMYPPHDLRGGYELMWFAALEELRRRGCDVMVLTTDYRASGVSDPGENARLRRELRWYWHEHRFPRLGWRRALRLERHNRDRLVEAMNDFAPDVVAWFAMGGMSLSLIELVRRAGVPAIGFVHDDWMLYGPQVDEWQRRCGGVGPLRAAVERVAGVPTRVDLSRAANWVFVSAASRQRAETMTGAFSESAIVHSGVDLELFRPMRPEAWRGSLLYVGRIDPRKGVETAVKALEELPDARLALVGTGDPEYLGALMKLAGELGVDRRLSHRYADHHELPSIYQQADAIVFPVRWQEPWGLVPLEAMAVGRPVVASGRGGSAEYLRDGENCLLYTPAEDHRALARAIVALEQDDSVRERLRAGGLRTARAHTRAAFATAAADLVVSRADPSSGAAAL
jgi:glycogen synthase